MPDLVKSYSAHQEQSGQYTRTVLIANHKDSDELADVNCTEGKDPGDALESKQICQLITVFLIDHVQFKQQLCASLTSGW